MVRAVGGAAAGDSVTGSVSLAHNRQMARERPVTNLSLHHLTITATDFGASASFYDVALGALGLRRLVEFGDEEEPDAHVEAIAWALSDADSDSAGGLTLWLVAGEHPTSGLHLGLAAQTRAEVTDFHTAAVSAGGTSHTAPRRWAIYRSGEFNAIVADPAGNLIEAVVRE